jgi:ABC-type sulfate transport system permease component
MSQKEWMDILNALPASLVAIMLVLLVHSPGLVEDLLELLM